MSKEKTSIKKEVGLRFCQFRRAINKTQQQLADELGIYQSTITNYEKGKTFPNLIYLYQFNEQFGLDINWLITGQGEIFFEDYKLFKNAHSVLDLTPNFHRDNIRKYTELLCLMEMPVIEQVILAKLLELKTLLKKEINDFYQNKSQDVKKENSNGDEA